MAPSAVSDPRHAVRDAAWLAVISLAGLVPRLAFLAAFPARQFTDFQMQVGFAQAYVERPFAAGYLGWSMFAPGLPLALSLLLRLSPAGADQTARCATALLTTLTALLPFVLWRGVLGLRPRVIASLLLALWPGHVIFAGVVSQDNWVLPPAIALAALAVRVLARGGGGYPVASALLFCAAAAVRPEMFVALLPLLPAAAGLLRPARSWPRRRLAVAAATLVAGLAVLGGLRWAGTGRFGLVPEHAGLTALGSYVPGAGVWWAVPNAYFASQAPELVGSDTAMRRAAWPIVSRELRRRPRFHLVRVFASAVASLLRSDVDSLYWSIGFNGAVADPLRPKVVAFTTRVQEPILRGSVVALCLSAAAVLLALLGRQWATVLIGASMVLKVAIHGVLATQSRYYVVVMAFALMTIALGVEQARRSPWWWTAASLAAGAALVLAGRAATERAQAWVLEHEEQLTYRFTLRDPQHVARLDCVVGEGLVSLLWANQAKAAIRLLHVNPHPGERVTADCGARVSRAAPVEVRVGDSYLDGGRPDRLVQSVAIDGAARLQRDVAAEAGRSWGSVPLGVVQPGQVRRVVVQMTARNAEPGANWGIYNTELWIETGPLEAGLR